MVILIMLSCVTFPLNAIYRTQTYRTEDIKIGLQYTRLFVPRSESAECVAVHSRRALDNTLPGL